MLRWNRIRQPWRKSGIYASRLAVRPHIPWYVRWGVALPVLLLAGWLVWWAYDVGLAFAGFHRSQAQQELEVLRNQIAVLKEENGKLFSHAASFERQAQIEHAANLETAKQLKSLNEENASLQEDLAFFQSLSLAGKRDGELSIHRLKVERDALPGEYRFRLLLVQSGQGRAKEFRGRLQLLVNAQRDGRKTVFTFPQEGVAAEDAAYQLNFKYYQRIERSFQVPSDMTVESAQVRVFEHGAKEPSVKQDARPIS